jgi:hypothetical protein
MTTQANKELLRRYKVHILNDRDVAAPADVGLDRPQHAGGTQRALAGAGSPLRQRIVF